MLHPAAAFLLDSLACGEELHNLNSAAVRALIGDPCNICDGQARQKAAGERSLIHPKAAHSHRQSYSD